MSLPLDDETLAGIDAAAASLEAAFIGLVALTPDQRRRLARMGDKSEAFCAGRPSSCWRRTRRCCHPATTSPRHRNMQCTIPVSGSNRL